MTGTISGATVEPTVPREPKILPPTRIIFRGKGRYHFTTRLQYAKDLIYDRVEWRGQPRRQCRKTDDVHRVIS